ncbi:hypothetical protein Acin_1730 [Acidaminococcus intestini RyC-MR95]|uniref:Uncharacterized protein n=1 Tax=Acidaminococcus intestini (strain RyC-MR95) TaxID=568816 RepID=G4Q3E7_ACIIR|nr:hypothetical protein Acin_1730 [Acidaminococcus intestini RyC-MR95]
MPLCGKCVVEATFLIDEKHFKGVFKAKDQTATVRCILHRA